MRDPARIDRIIEKLHKLWLAYPDMRLCQLVLNCANGKPFYFEDEDFEERVDALLGGAKFGTFRIP